MATHDLGHKLTDKELAALEKRIAGVYKDARDSLNDTISEYFAKFVEREKHQQELLKAGKITEEQYKQWRLNQIGRGKRFEALRDKVAERYTKANETAVSYVNDTTPGVYSLNRNYSAYTIERVSGNVGFDLWDEQTVKRLIVEEPNLMPYYPKKRAVAREIDLAWGKEQITASVTSGILQGYSVGKIADDMQERMEKMNRASALRTARTAITGAQNAGRQDSYIAAEKMGIKMKREWLATLDNLTRHAHAVLDGQRVGVNEPFKVDGYEIMFPGDPTAKAYLVYNCRCTMIAEVDGVDTSDALRRDRDGLIPDMTFAQWEASKRGYSSDPISSIRDEEVKKWRKSLKNKENVAILMDKIASGEISTKISTQKQARHIEGTEQFNQYLDRRLAGGKTPQSVLTISVEEAQNLVDRYKGTGDVDIQKTGKDAVKIIEYCDADLDVGRYYGNDMYHDTKRFAIFYSKKGTHVVPTPPKKEDV